MTQAVFEQADAGTVAHAAVIHGRRFIGCDVRQSQVELAQRRIDDVMGVFA